MESFIEHIYFLDFKSLRIEKTSGGPDEVAPEHLLALTSQASNQWYPPFSGNLCPKFCP